MKKLLLFIAVAFAQNLQAQFAYNLSTLTGQPYTPLGAGATSLNNDSIWSYESYSVPLGFTYKIGTHPVTQLNVAKGTGLPVATDTAGIADGFNITDGNVVDRGFNDSIASLSPISYIIEGTAGSRICKLEFRNVGYLQELLSLGAMNDSFSFQAWLYEGSNIFEFHYGPNSIVNSSAYLYGQGPFVGYVVNGNLSTFAMDKMYFLKGNPASPVIDSMSTAMPAPTGVLTSYPTNGTVYRFTPRAVEVEELNAAQAISIYPTSVAQTLNIVSGGLQPVSYTIVSVSGDATGLAGILSAGTSRVDVTSLPAGMYIVDIRGSGNTPKLKFIKY